MNAKYIHEITCGIISTADCLANAKALLYESYIKHLAWEIKHDNPSNIKIHHLNERTTLTDDYDDLSVWFSINHKNNLVACARLCHDDNNGLLEIERYNNAAQTLKPLLSKKKMLNIIELNREAILPEYSDKKELFGLLLLKEVFEYCLINRKTILTTCNIDDWVSIYDLISFQCLDNYTFKYFDSEPHPVLVYLATPIEIKELLININSCLKKLKNTKPAQLHLNTQIDGASLYV